MATGHQRHGRPDHWRRLVVVLTSKFRDGAWLIVVYMPLLIYVLHNLGTHQHRLSQEAAVEPDRAQHLVEAIAERTRHRVVVPVAGADRVTLNAIGYLLSLLGQGLADGKQRAVIEAVHVTDDPEEGRRLQQEWAKLRLTVPLVVLESPERATTTALVQYIQFLQNQSGVRTIVTVAIPETVPTRWWHPLVRNYLASGLKLALLSRPGVTVLSVPLAIHD